MNGRLRFDPLLLAACLALTALGLVMVYSASAITAQERLGNAFYFLERQAVAAALGLVAMAVVMKLGYRKLARLSYPLLLAAVALLVVVLVPGVGTVVGGARRWIRLLGFGLQPAEVAKLAWIVYLAYSLAKKREKVATFSVGFLPHLLVAGVLVALCMKEPDFGSSVVILFLLFVMLFAAGTKLSYLIGSILVAIPVAWTAVSSSPYRMARLMAFIDPMGHRHDSGYQVAESLMSIGSGGWTGLGLGDGRQKLFFLPEAHNDFIAAIIGEELGLLGVAAMIGLFAIILWRGLRASLHASEPFGTYLGLGITSLMGFQAVVNMGVAMALLPTKGLTLPFVSYGGSSLLMMMAAMGVLLSISATAEAKAAGAGRRRFQALPFDGAGGRADVRVLIAGGGTGGHLFPGIALAEEVTTRHHKNSVVFVGTDRGLEARVVPAAGYPLEIIPARGLKGMGLLRLLQGLLTLPAALFASWRILRKHRPDVVVGVGGYASFPVVLCAWLQRVPTAVQEQNALPGLTNRILGRIVKVVFIAFEGARRYFPAGRSNLIGNPIRAKLTDNFLRSRAEHSKFTVLVFGGSLGAKRVNALMLEALDQLGDLKEGMRFVHQTGKADLESVKQGYAARGFDAEVVEFIDDMSSAYATADLVVCRAGATTVAELTVCKKAAILIPYPYATDNHQEVNARSLVDAGAALMFRESELTGQSLATNIRGLKDNPDRLRRMEKQAGLLGRPEAAKELADVCVQLMVQTWGPHGRNRPDKEQKKGKEAA